MEGCVLLQVGGVNILDFSYAVINGTYKSSPKNKMQLQRVPALLAVNSMVSLTERFSILRTEWSVDNFFSW